MCYSYYYVFFNILSVKDRGISMEKRERYRRYARKRIVRRSLKRISMVVIAIIICLIGVKWFACKDDVDAFYDMNMDEIADGFYQEAGMIESILDENEKMMYSIHYPKFEQKAINQDIKKMINKLIKYTNQQNQQAMNVSLEERGMLYMNYDSYLVGENIASVLFYIELNTPRLANPETKIISKHYDLSQGTVLSDDDLFKGDYIKAIADYCMDDLSKQEEYQNMLFDEEIKELIQPNKKNYMNLSLTSKGVLVTFSKEQLFSSFKACQVAVPYDYLQEYLQFDYQSETIVIDKKPVNEIPEVEAPVIDPNRPMIALTFDDGPNPSSTNRILDVLAKYNSRATFFVVGNRLRNYPETLQRIVREQSEIGSHTYNHKSLNLLTTKEIQKELAGVDDYLKELLNQDAATLRPPYGAVNDTVREAVNKPMIYWSVDTEDWKSRNTDKIVQHVLANVKDGDIILFHDLYDTTAAAIEILVPELIEQGYQIVTVSEMFQAKGISLEPGKVYYSAR